MKQSKIISATILALSAVTQSIEVQGAENVLFIIVDDLRPELNCYGADYIVSPNIDKLAAESAQFMSAYSNIPVSGASRASLMTGLRPTRTQFVDVESLIERDAPNIPTIAKHFRDNGYTTISNSKVIHGAGDAAESWDEVWMPAYEDTTRRTWRDYLSPDNLSKERTRHGPEAFESMDVEDDAYYDGKTARKSIADLQRLKESGDPFFMAVGIVKPHLPFNAPKKYWDLYPEQSISLPESFYFDRSGFPSQVFHTWGELRYYRDIDDKADIGAELAKKLIRGYRACVSYADAQVGRILDELERLGLDENTTVVLIGDHGWSLGDHNQWCKHSNFSVANHTVMMVRLAGEKRGRKIETITEFVDLYPTICAAAGVEIPSHTEGENLVPSITDSKTTSKDYAVVKWKRGVTLIDPKYTYTEWYNDNDGSIANMLFDRANDPHELRNLANDPKYKIIVDQQSELLRTRRGKNY